MGRLPPLISLLFLLAASAGRAQAAPPATATAPPVTGVTLTYAADPAQVEIVTPAGRTVFIDVWNGDDLTRTPIAQDILLTTHLHYDHYNRTFSDAFPGRQLLAETGRIELPDVTITGIAASHNSNDPIREKGATDYIYIVETGGVRIVHFGDLGQDALTDEQLAAIGKVDVAISQLANAYSDMDAENLKGINLMEQVKPRLLIPTHSDSDTIKTAAGHWKGFYFTSQTIAISPQALPPGRSLLVLDTMAAAYGKLFKLEPWR